MPSNPSGTLTPGDREFLRSDGDYYTGDNASQSRYDRRRAMRGRIVQSLLDFQDIHTYLEDKQRRKIFSEPDESRAEDDLEFTAALQSLLEWLYLGCREEGRNFDELLTNAVNRAEEDYQRRNNGDLVDVSTDFGVEVTQQYEGVEELARRLEDGENIFADNIYQIPSLPQFDVDTEKIETVRIIPSRAQLHMDSERKIVSTILQERLGVEPDVEIVGVAELEEVEENDRDGDKPSTIDKSVDQAAPDLVIPGVNDERDEEEEKDTSGGQ